MTKDTNGIAGGKYVAKAGVWYTVCNFIFRGMAFITTPIFTRLLSKNELGEFSNFTSWITILTVITSLDLAQSVIRSKLEHEEDMDSYILSILLFSTIWTLVIYSIVCLKIHFFSDIFQIDKKYIHLMFIYLLVSPAYNMLITKHRAFYKYKTFVVLTGIIAISGTFFSLLMVMLMEDKLAGRTLGHYLPYIFISFIIYIILILRGKKLKVKYWKYACAVCIPLVPHKLSLYLLSSSDKIIITNICGVEYTSIYSVAYSAYHIVTVLYDSMNKAWAPWLLESLHMKRYEEIRDISKKYICIFTIIIVGILLVIPEIIMILGGEQYKDAIYCLPPLITGCLFQFIYTMYVNIEFYTKKTFWTSGATIFATVINIILNFVFIPMNIKFSYVIAAYTTLVGYVILFICHYFIVKHLEMSFVYNTKYIIFILLSVFLFSLILNLLYHLIWIRYVILLFYVGILMSVGYKKRNYILELLKRKNK